MPGALLQGSNTTSMTFICDTPKKDHYFQERPMSLLRARKGLHWLTPAQAPDDGLAPASEILEGSKWLVVWGLGCSICSVGLMIHHC